MTLDASVSATTTNEMTMNTQDRRLELLAFLSTRPGRGFSAAELEHETGHPKKFVGRALAGTPGAGFNVRLPGGRRQKFYGLP